MCLCFSSFVCAAVVKLDKEHKRFEFYGPPGLWNGKTIKKRITGNSALYILEDEVLVCLNYFHQLIAFVTLH